MQRSVHMEEEGTSPPQQAEKNDKSIACRLDDNFHFCSFVWGAVHAHIHASHHPLHIKTVLNRTRRPPTRAPRARERHGAGRPGARNAVGGVGGEHDGARIDWVRARCVTKAL